jgi:hypothetical protein
MQKVGSVDGVSPRMQKRYFLSVFTAVFLLFIIQRGVKTGAPAVAVNVSADSVLIDATSETNGLCPKNLSGATIATNFASSGTLQTRRENGARTEIFTSTAVVDIDAPFVYPLAVIEAGKIPYSAPDCGNYLFWGTS